MQAIVTKDYMQDKLDTLQDDQLIQFVGRALVVIFNNQTEDEKRIDDTRIDNGIGFTPADAYSGGITAKTFLSRGTLLEWQVERWTKKNVKGCARLAKYWRQLDVAAQNKRMN
jgi:hypothetical protein